MKYYIVTALAIMAGTSYALFTFQAVIVFVVPTYKETCSNNPLTFSNCGGYTYAHTYIEYIEVKYGWDAVLEIIETENYEEVFGKSREDMYDEWIAYLKEYYQ